MLPLGVNQHIIKTVQRLPRKYGGLNIFDLNIKCLRAKLHYLRTHWGFQSQEGQHLQLGLESNIFERDYNALEYLAEYSWFKHLWCLCYMFGCELSINFPAHVQHQRTGDRALMKVFLDTDLFDRKTILVLQHVQCFKKVHFLSDILCTDGRTVNPRMLSPHTGMSSRELSFEKPTRGNIATWRLALCNITSSHLTLKSPLGQFLVIPHNDIGWYVSDTETSLFHLRADDNFDVYQLPPNCQATRRPTYHKVPSTRGIGSPVRHKLATVSLAPDGNSATLRSTVPSQQLSNCLMHPLSERSSVGSKPRTVGQSHVQWRWMMDQRRPFQRYPQHGKRRIEHAGETRRRVFRRFCPSLLCHGKTGHVQLGRASTQVQQLPRGAAGCNWLLVDHQSCSHKTLNQSAP